MQEHKRDILEVLRTELKFLEMGGYSMRGSWGPQFIFEDTPTCVNCGRRDNPIIPCTECVLIDLVPSQHRSEEIPCRHIPLDASGRTLNSLYGHTDPQAIEEEVGKWLRATIARLEQEEKAPPGANRN
jgi:hypothetical protein